MQNKEKAVGEFIQTLAVCADITRHFVLNKKSDTFIHNIFVCVKLFMENSTKELKFQSLKNCHNVRGLTSYATAVEEPKDEFSSTFFDFRKSANVVDLFSRTFSGRVSNVPRNVKMNLQNYNATLT